MRVTEFDDNLSFSENGSKTNDFVVEYVFEAIEAKAIRKYNIKNLLFIIAKILHLLLSGKNIDE